MFFTPEVYGKQDYLVNVDKDDIIACKEMYEFEAVKLFSEIAGVLKSF